MHVAICDDNVADRKHLERLLSRESDKRMGTPNILYIESFGDRKHFLENPLKYNIVFMDMCSEPGLVKEIINELVDMGFNAPLVLYSSKIDYRQLPNLPRFVMHCQKPYLPDPLPEFLHYGDKNALGHVEKITIHKVNRKHARQIVKDDIMYAAWHNDSYALFTKDSEIVDIKEDIAQLRQIFEPYREFVRINKNTIANFRYVSAIMFFNVMMQDYRQFRIMPTRYKEFKYLKEEIDFME